ncbi:hypothetical protein [Holdemanella porci]|uniref:hypothetical protein n=1 Tax=Holdemanella porci TaxID=2652276 RepID=UPI003AB630A8
MGNKDKKEQQRAATPEQMSFINESIRSAGLGDSLDDFASRFVSDSYRANFATTLSKQLQATQSIADGFAKDGTFQPQLSEQLYQQLNINPRIATSEQIDRWLEQPQYFSEELRGLSQYLNYAVGQYHRSIWYFNTIKSFNYTLNPTDIDNGDSVSEKDYLHAYEICLKTLRKMNIKYQFPKIDLQVLIDGVGFYWIAETDDTLSFLQLPSEWCYIVAPWTYGFQFAFDLTYFDRYVGLDIAIPELYEAYNHFVSMRESKNLSPEKIQYLQYYPVPVDRSWVFTFDPVHPDKVPPLSSAMGAALDVISYKQLLKDMLALDLFKVIALKIPLKKDGNNMAISYNEAREITQVIQSSFPDNIIAYSSPFDSESIAVNQTDRFSDIVGISNDTFYSNVGVSDGNFGSNQIRQGTALQFASTVDFAYASTHMYSQFSNCVNWILLQKTRKYKFTVTFFGNKLNDQAETKSYADLVRTANMPVMKLFAYAGFEPFEVISTLRLESELGVKNLMEPLTSAFQKSAKDSGKANGRPQQEVVSESGEKSRDFKPLNPNEIG